MSNIIGALQPEDRRFFEFERKLLVATQRTYCFNVATALAITCR